MLQTRAKPPPDGTGSGFQQFSNDLGGSEVEYETSGEGSTQTPLSLRFESKKFWPALKDKIGGSEAVAAIALALHAATGPVSYSRNHNHYVRPRRYSHRLYTFRNIVGGVDHLDGRKLIIHDRSEPGRLGWQSNISPRPELTEIVASIVGDGSGLELTRPPETIILRNSYGQGIEYQDTPATRRMRRAIEEFNEALRAVDLNINMRAQVRRIFNTSWERGGRFYAMGGAWQCLPKEQRGELRIGGEAVAELDFRCLHPTVLYAWAGAPAPVDCYQIKDWPRALVKLAVLIMINASNYFEALGRIYREDAISPLAAPGTAEAKELAKVLIADIKKFHAPISAYFHSDAGAKLMRLDSDIADTILTDTTAAGIIALPVHDSFICRKSDAEFLKNAMLESAQKHGVQGLEISGFWTSNNIQ
ncbi:hypothetical protein [Mesorhizobium sp. IMUNJ 23232]|uniref:hypothetical protein n=1 Tax=Mesorhizobium sp. IMUNJ 23232 TaxID=3376064 RepID=UPI003788A4AF